MSKPISQFFADLGFPLKNIRWSWGAKNVDGTALLLRAWDDEYSFKHKTVTALREPERYLVSDSYGLDERIVQLKELWAGGIAAYVVIATVKDADEHPREIKDYREDAVFSVERLPEALEAAHLLGRDWRLGHNRASDGLLLRRDLHTLYDRGLLRITDEGVVEIDARISSHYGYLDGVQLATVKLPLGH